MPKQNQTKSSPKKKKSFVLGNNIFLDKRPTWSVVDKPSDTLLERTDFPFAFRYQLQKAFLMFFVLSFFPKKYIHFLKVTESVGIQLFIIYTFDSCSASAGCIKVTVS